MFRGNYCEYNFVFHGQPFEGITSCSSMLKLNTICGSQIQYLQSLCTCGDTFCSSTMTCTSNIFLVCGYVHCLLIDWHLHPSYSSERWFSKQAVPFVNASIARWPIQLAQKHKVRPYASRAWPYHCHDQKNPIQETNDTNKSQSEKLKSGLSKGKAGRMHHTTESHPWRCQGRRFIGFLLYKVQGNWKIPHIYTSLLEHMLSQGSSAGYASRVTWRYFTAPTSYWRCTEMPMFSLPP